MAAASAGIVALSYGSAAHAGSEWAVTAFRDQSVSLVKVRPYYPAQVAAVVNGRLKLSRDGGAWWNDSYLPVQVRDLAFGASGVIYVGSDTGIYVSTDEGVSWRLWDQGLTARKITVALAVAPRHVFALMHEGAGTQVSLYRFDLEGRPTVMNFPSTGLVSLFYDPINQGLYAAASGGIYVSMDQGQSWKLLPGAGSYASKVVVKNTTIWALYAEGLYRSQDSGGSWTRLARPGDINGTNYGSDMRLQGLAVTGTGAYYGSWSLGFPYRFLVGYADSTARSLVSARVMDIAEENGRIWVASTGGLWTFDPATPAQGGQPRRPVILIPGILGSMPAPLSMLNNYKTYVPMADTDIYRTNLVVDPIARTYDSLVSSLTGAGYVKGRTLFTFPYEWRQDNQISAIQLAQKVADVRRICDCGQVDIIAHSMGGLVARSYIQSPSYRSDVATLYQLGTPNRGSLMAYPAWEAAEFGQQGWQGRLMRAIFEIEAWHRGRRPLVEYIRESVISVGQLLPTTDYLQGRRYPVGYPPNPYLDELNHPVGVTRLLGRTALRVIGSGAHSTPASYEVERPSGGLNWPHGQVRRTEMAPGDGTVSLSSLETLKPTILRAAGDHGRMVEEAVVLARLQEDLTGRYLPLASDIAARLGRYLMVYVKSPVRIEVRDQNGNVLSDQANTIRGSYYTGSQSEAQFALLPEPAGIYSIKVIGTGEGGYSVGVRMVEENDDEHTVEMSGSTRRGQEDQYSYDSEADDLVRLSTTAAPRLLAASISLHGGPILDSSKMSFKSYIFNIYLNRPGHVINLEARNYGNLNAPVQVSARKPRLSLLILATIIVAIAALAIWRRR